MLISYNGMIVRISTNTVRQTGRGTQGVRVINLTKEDKLASVARIADEGVDAENTDNDTDADQPQPVETNESTAENTQDSADDAGE